tara:strand:+ start:7303 stop:7734 length:432 start_codon:yes stop_codon:yes gene_type:complete
MARLKKQIDWTQINPENFQLVKQSVRRLKRYKHAITRRSPSGQFYLGDEHGNNLMPKQYADLRLSDDIWGAWKNAYITNHWVQTEGRNIKGTARDIASAVGNTSDIPQQNTITDIRKKMPKIKDGKSFDHEEWKSDIYECLMD